MISSLADLRSDARFKATGNSSSTDFSDADTLLYANQYYGQALSLTLGNEKANLYKEADTDTKNITAGSNEITPDTDMQAILRVAIKYPSSSSDYVPAKFISFDKIDCDIDKYTPDGFEYTFYDSKLIIFVGVEKDDIEAVTSGVKIYNLNDITELSSGTDTPKLVEHFRDYISTGMAWEYCNANEMYSKADRLKIRLNELEKALRTHYANLVKEKGLAVRRENFE